MTTEDSPTVEKENEALLHQIESIEKEVKSVGTALARGRNVRLMLLVGVVVLIGVTVKMFYNLAMEFTSDEFQIAATTAIKEHLDQSSSGYVDQVRTLAEFAQPVVKDALTEQIEKDKERFMEAFTEERKTLVENLQTKLGDQVKARYLEAGQRNREILQEAFPQIDDEEKLGQIYAGVEQSMEQLLQKYYSDELRNQVLEMYDTWDKFAMAEVPQDGDPKLEQQLIGYLLQIVTTKLSDHPGLSNNSSFPNNSIEATETD